MEEHELIALREGPIDEENEVVRAVMSQVLSDTKKMRDFAMANKLPEQGVHEDTYYVAPFINESDGYRAFLIRGAMQTIIEHMVKSDYIHRRANEHGHNFLVFHCYPQSILKEDARRGATAAKGCLGIIIAVPVIVILIWLFVF